MTAPCALAISHGHQPPADSGWRVAIKHLYQPNCQFIPRRRGVDQTIPSTKTKSWAKSRSIDHARVGPVEPDLLHAFSHNILQRAVQLELPTDNVGVREQFAELENQLRFGNKPQLDGFSIAGNLCGARLSPGNVQIRNSKIRQGSGVENGIDMVTRNDVAE